MRVTYFGFDELCHELFGQSGGMKPSYQQCLRMACRMGMVQDFSDLGAISSVLRRWSLLTEKCEIGYIIGKEDERERCITGYGMATEEANAYYGSLVGSVGKPDLDIIFKAHRSTLAVVTGLCFGYMIMVATGGDITNHSPAMEKRRKAYWKVFGKDE